jgi:hypothetical protein
MKRTAVLGAWCLGVLLLAGCGTTPPSNYYLLSAMDEAPPDGMVPALGIGPVHIPEYLRRNSLVYRLGDNRLQIADSERWGEPLEEGVQRVLSLNLADLLATGNLSYYPFHSQRPPDYGVSVNVLNLDVDEQRAALVAEWLVYRPATGEPVGRRISRLQYDLPAGGLAPERVAPAYSALLYQLSQLIASVISADMDS